MYKLTVTPPTADVSAWLEFSTLDEIPLVQQSQTRPTMAWSMAQRSAIEVVVSGVTHTIPYAHILNIFPDLDPDVTYVTTRIKLHRPYQGPPIK